VHLVLIETSGNQAYIFATNKLRENVGASELTYRAGTLWLMDALTSITNNSRYSANNIRTVQDMHALVRSEPPIGNGNPVEILIATSGKALLLVDDQDIGKRIVREVTRRALIEAPGMEIFGVVSPAFDLNNQSIHEMIRYVHREYEAVRSRLPSPQVRFQRLPIIMDCGTSGLPAARWDASGRSPGPRSAVSLAKVQAASSGLDRIRNTISTSDSDSKYRIPYSTETLEDLGCDWLAVVHADGNGLGQVFLNFDQFLPNGTQGDLTRWNRSYIECLRNFSVALDECTLAAFQAAIGHLKLHHDRQNKRAFLPVVPLVLGGDDLTVVCDGMQALRFTKEFITHFEQCARENHHIRGITSSSKGKQHLPQGLTSCAGVTIMKPHFPFFAAYELAEALLKSAKQHKPYSAIDFHILYDASNPDFNRIREEWTLYEPQARTLLTGRPYLVGNHVQPPKPHRHWSDLEARIAAIQATDDDGRRLLPNSMLHELREGLFLGRKAADARLQLVYKRYQVRGLDKIVGQNSGQPSLFWLESSPSQSQRTEYRTALIDALDAAEFWQ
jgi:hypothetical protein